MAKSIPRNFSACLFSTVWFSQSNSRLAKYFPDGSLLGYNRLGLTVSAKLACAVKRNRIKRLFREAYRLNEDKFADGIDLVLVARVRAVGASYQEIEKSLLRALKDNKVAAART